MLSITARGSPSRVVRSISLCFTSEALAKTVPSPRQSRCVSTSSPSSTPTRSFWTSDDLLIKALRRRQESYRLAQVSQGARHKADRLEAVQLAKSETRWIVQHVRALQSTSKTQTLLSRASRRHLVSMSVQMTRDNVPISYLLGSVPFGSLSQELTVRPPILLPRPETEHWATEVVNTLKKLGASQLEDVRVVDLCTGSGCIALLVADAIRERLGTGKGWKVVACDRSKLAVELAKENARKLGFQVDQDASNLHVVEADVFSDSEMDRLAELAGGPFDLVLSNPPYIPRREWNALSAEVKEHEDPAALIGERHINQHNSDAKQSYVDRHGLAFHQRLAELLHRPTFSASSPPLPRLVAEYGKGQQRQVEKLHVEARSPKDRLPRVVQVEGLVVVGVGNATTHPLTRHSIGQAVLDPLLQGLVEADRVVRGRLREVRDELERRRLEAVRSGNVDTAHRSGWDKAVPTTLPIYTTDGVDTGRSLDLASTDPPQPRQLSKLTGKSAGWSTTFTLLIPSPSPDSLIYAVPLSIFKPSQPMNLSGVGLKAFLTFLPRVTSDDILVLQDELDLPFGSVKSKLSGSARGHNGVKDIIARLGVAAGGADGPRLARVRIGIGRPEQTQSAAARAESWLPSSLMRKSKKPMPIDRWVLSPLSDAELHSCRTETSPQSVLAQVKDQTLQWALQRCQTLTDAKPAAIQSRKDQFGLPRTVWIQ